VRMGTPGSLIFVAALRRDGHTKVYCGDQKRLCDRTHV